MLAHLSSAFKVYMLCWNLYQLIHVRASKRGYLQAVGTLILNVCYSTLRKVYDSEFHVRWNTFQIHLFKDYMVPKHPFQGYMSKIIGIRIRVR